MNKLVRILIAVIALAVAAFTVSMSYVPKKTADPVETGDVVVLTPYTVPPIQTPDDELLHPDNYETDIFWNSDTHWLAMALEKESGHEWPDWAVIMIGDVIMHRVQADICPDTIQGVLKQPGQYEPFFEPFDPFMPEERYIDLAERVLDGESYLTDPDILYQALFPQGDEVVLTYYDEALDTTTYFCKEVGESYE